MAEAKERNLTPAIPSDMQSLMKRCENLEKEVRSLKLNLAFMNRYVQTQKLSNDSSETCNNFTICMIFVVQHQMVVEEMFFQACSLLAM